MEALQQRDNTIDQIISNSLPPLEDIAHGEVARGELFGAHRKMPFLQSQYIAQQIFGKRDGDAAYGTSLYRPGLESARYHAPKYVAWKPAEETPGYNDAGAYKQQDEKKEPYSATRDTAYTDFKTAAAKGEEAWLKKEEKAKSPFDYSKGQPSQSSGRFDYTIGKTVISSSGNSLYNIVQYNIPGMNNQGGKTIKDEKNEDSGGKVTLVSGYIPLFGGNGMNMQSPEVMIGHVAGMKEMNVVNADGIPFGSRAEQQGVMDFAYQITTLPKPTLGTVEADLGKKLLAAEREVRPNLRLPGRGDSLYLIGGGNSDADSKNDKENQKRDILSLVDRNPLGQSRSGMVTAASYTPLTNRYAA